MAKGGDTEVDEFKNMLYNQDPDDWDLQKLQEIEQNKMKTELENYTHPVTHSYY